MYQSNTALVIVGWLSGPLDIRTSSLQHQQNTRYYIIAQPHSLTQFQIALMTLFQPWLPNTKIKLRLIVSSVLSCGSGTAVIFL